MDRRTISQQVLVEQEMLNHIMSAVKTILDWKIQEHDLSRKLTSLLFITESFQRHLIRLMELEECHGLMDSITEGHPHLQQRVDSLKQDHKLFRTSFDGIMPRLKRISAHDHDTMGMMCDELLVLMNRLAEHSGKETELIERTLLNEESARPAAAAASLN
jgi:hypothetical protein